MEVKPVPANTFEVRPQPLDDPSPAERPVAHGLWAAGTGAPPREALIAAGPNADAAQLDGVSTGAPSPEALARYQGAYSYVSNDPSEIGRLAILLGHQTKRADDKTRAAYEEAQLAQLKLKRDELLQQADDMSDAKWAAAAQAAGGALTIAGGARDFSPSGQQTFDAGQQNWQVMQQNWDAKTKGGAEIFGALGGYAQAEGTQTQTEHEANATGLQTEADRLAAAGRRAEEAAKSIQDLCKELIANLRQIDDAKNIRWSA